MCQLCVGLFQSSGAGTVHCCGGEDCNSTSLCSSPSGVKPLQRGECYQCYDLHFPDQMGVYFLGCFLPKSTSSSWVLLAFSERSLTSSEWDDVCEINSALTTVRMFMVMKEDISQCKTELSVWTWTWSSVPQRNKIRFCIHGQYLVVGSIHWTISNI